MNVTVYVTPKPSVLDPQGAAVAQAMQHLDFNAANVRVGKMITFEVEGRNDDAFRARLDKLCQDLLSNPVIEDYVYLVE